MKSIRLTSSADYYIASAIRGPDADFTYASSMAKAITTCVIRYFIGFKRLRDLGIVHSPEQAVEAWNCATSTQHVEVTGFFLSQYHFSFHVIQAFMALGKDEDPEVAKAATEHYTWLCAERVFTPGRIADVARHTDP